MAKFLVHAPWRLNTCSAVHSDVGEKCWTACYQTLSSCDSSRGRARSDFRSDEVYESSFPYLTPQCWHVSKDAIAKYSTVRLSHWDEHVELLTDVTQHHCFQLVHDACCPAGHCGIWFEWYASKSSTHLRCDISETSLCSIACMRPVQFFVPLSASLVACRLRHLSSSVSSFTHAHRGGGALPMCNVSQLSLLFFRIFSLVALAA